MRLKKGSFIFSFALAALLVVGQAAFAEGAENNGVGFSANGNNMMGNMDGNGMMNMMNGNGMTKMMENGNMSSMMNAMNSPQGEKMIEACGDFMESQEGNVEKSNTSK
ncbi:hypothetical protein IQ283_08070 (plasmid) [Alkalihalobacillus hwajinpoensis]|uniref:hypothetical protein n=1 Tax=Guptibacillus hwajinpoensis TaxID=208199 RepID=UPI001883DE2C|nr:hypothetical protein [Pseudalkalibacillus hwajinpoensis]MBF0706565.1 hypothetical protein [Pseudalkalibacillus hwajinpoensis]